MGAKLSKTQESHGPDIDGQYPCDTQLCVRKAGRRRKKQKSIERPVGEALRLLVRQWFRNFHSLFAAIDDPRDTDRVFYPLEQILCLAVLMFAARISSRRELDRMSGNDLFRDNLCMFSGCSTDTVMVSEQMINVLKKLDIDELANVQPELVRSLIEKKRLQDAYVCGHLAVCSDATGIFSSSNYHCDECLTQQHSNGTVTYMHNMLEAKVLSANGLALSVLSEPVKNPADGNYIKQDCETKAFARLLPRIKEKFPRQPIVHLLDSLYAQAPVFERIAKAKHKFICCFKRGSIPTLYDEAMELLRLRPENKITVRTHVSGKGAVRQTFRWLDNLEYKGMTLGFIHCEEVDKDGNIATYSWLTSFYVKEQNVQEIAQAGRMRWKIENEGFNQQKTGYEMEHFCDCNDLNVMICLYLILQIAHMFMQLLAKSDLIADPAPILKHLAYLLLESLRNNNPNDNSTNRHPPPGQIRLHKAET